MQKRIHKSIMLVTLISVIFLAALLSFIFYGLLAKQVNNGLWDRADIVRQLLNAGEDNGNVLTKLPFSDSQVRYTLIASDGAVLFDSQTSAVLENHSKRTEFRQAIDKGKGESKRFSDTIGLESYYVAYQLQDGSVIRLSQSSRSIFGVFCSVIPGAAFVMVMILILGSMLSKYLTKRIIQPINQVDLSKDDIVLYDELSMFVRTITKYKKRVEEQIVDVKSKSDTINAIISSIKEGLVLLDCNGVIITANKSAMDLFQATEEVLGKNILEFTRDNEIFENTQKALAGISCEITYKKTTKYYQIFFSPATEGGVIILFLDITERMTAEKMRREFTANVTHELKTPLTNISGYAEMLSSGMAKKEDFAVFLERIRDETSRLVLLVDDILLLSRLDEGNNRIEKQKIDLYAMTKQVVEALTEKAAQNHITISLTGGTVIAEVNPSMIYELLLNLVDNGIKYNKPNGSVLIDLSQKDGAAKIMVKDTGIGIPPEHQDRIFERFYRVEKSRSKKTGGTGLGLSIAKHIVQVHNGTIDLKSQVDGGTIITVLFEDKNKMAVISNQTI